MVPLKIQTPKTIKELTQIHKVSIEFSLVGLSPYHIFLATKTITKHAV